MFVLQNETGGDWPVLTIATGGQTMAKRFANCIGKL